MNESMNPNTVIVIMTVAMFVFCIFVYWISERK